MAATTNLTVDFKDDLFLNNALDNYGSGLVQSTLKAITPLTNILKIDIVYPSLNVQLIHFLFFFETDVFVYLKYNDL